MTDTTVKYFNSTMSGTTAISNTPGTLIGILDACLVNGFGSVSLNSLVVSSNVATGTVVGGHNFAMVGNTGPVVTIAGATPSGLNGAWRIASVPSSTTFTFATSGITDQTATGSISAKRSPAGFSKVFSGTNKAVYRADSISSTRLYLRIDDSNNNYSRCCGYETMSDVDTGTNLFPTNTQVSGGLYVYKATSTNRAWTLFADDRLIYFFCNSTGGTSWEGGFVFGDIDSFVASDTYGCLIIAETSSTGSHSLFYLANNTGSYLARPYNKLGTAVACSRYAHGYNNNIGYGTYQIVPALSDGRIHVHPVDLWESTIRRGMMPGLYSPLHHGDLAQGQIIPGDGALLGRSLVSQCIYQSNYNAALDIMGPWR